MQKIKNPTITARLTQPFSRNRRNAIIGAAAYSTTRILQAAWNGLIQAGNAAGEPQCHRVRRCCSPLARAATRCYTLGDFKEAV
jgi:hypothetical protein